MNDLAQQLEDANNAWAIAASEMLAAFSALGDGLARFLADVMLPPNEPTRARR